MWERLTRVRLEQGEKIVREGIVGEVEVGKRDRSCEVIKIKRYKF